jgi:hypothetical protein
MAPVGCPSAQEVIVGLCACFVGVFVAAPIAQLMLAYVYLVSIGEQPAATAPPAPAA